jgi:hypothetical protein
MKTSNGRKRELKLHTVVILSIVICGSAASAWENVIVLKVKKWDLSV